MFKFKCFLFLGFYKSGRKATIVTFLLLLGIVLGIPELFQKKMVICSTQGILVLHNVMKEYAFELIMALTLLQMYIIHDV